MMKILTKIIFIGCMIGITITGVNAMAEDHCGSGDYRGHGWHMDQKKMAEMRTAHLKALHNTLKLDAKQETAWNKFAASFDTMPIARPDKAEWEKLNAPQRMEKMQEGLRKHEEHMSEQLAALKEFYAVLTPEQQKAFDKHSMPHHRDMHGMHDHPDMPEQQH